MTAADRPSVTDDARAEAERRVHIALSAWEGEEYTEGYVYGFTRGAGWAAGRAETVGNDGLTDAEREEYARQYRTGPAFQSVRTPLDAGRAETTTATVEQVARVIAEHKDPHGECVRGLPGTTEAQHQAEILEREGLLATARTRPTRTVYSVQHWEDADGIRAGWVTGYGGYTTSREDAEATFRHQERQHPDATFRLAQAEVTTWTEVE